MAKRINWDAVSRSQRAQNHGSESVCSELPRTGSYADKVRYMSEKEEIIKKKKKNNTNKPLLRGPKNNRLVNLQNTINTLIKIHDSWKWKARSQGYRDKQISHLEINLNALLREFPSKSSDSNVIKGKQILSYNKALNDLKKRTITP